MLRRRFLEFGGIAAGLASTTLLGQPPRVRRAIGLRRTFMLGESERGHRLLDVRHADGRIYSLENDGGFGAVHHRIVCSDLAGGVQWAWDLHGMYTSLGVRKDGSIVVFRPTEWFEEYTASGALIRKVRLPGRPLHLEMSGDVLLRLHVDGALDAVEIDNDTPTPRVLARELFVGATYVMSDRVGEQEAVFVDGGAARFAMINAKAGSVQMFEARGPEFDKSRTFYAEQKAAASREGHALNTVSLAAFGSGPQGFYGLVSPYDPKRAAIVLLSHNGDPQGVLEIQMPDRGGLFNVPKQLIATSDTLALVFAAGGVASYAL